MKTVFLAGVDGTKPYLEVGEAHLADGTRRRLLQTLGGSLKLAPDCLVHEDRDAARRVLRQVRAYREREGRGLPFEAAAARLAAKAAGAPR